MTKRDFKQFTRLPQEREYYIKRVERLEKSLENVPTVKTKVQSSQKEFPYVQTHVTVDAPEPVRYTSIMKDITRTKRRLRSIENRLDKLTGMIESVEDSRTRQILTMRYIDGEKLKTVSAKMDLTDQHVMRMISIAIKNF